MAMSPQELCWRVAAKFREQWDRRRIRALTPTIATAQRAGAQPARVRAEIFGDHFPSRAELEGAHPDGPAAVQRLLERAELICQNRVTLYDLKDHWLGERIDWNYEYKARRKTPLCFNGDVDYRDYQEVGDCKFAWEPSRFQHIGVLGRAYRISGETRYAAAVASQIRDWIRQCPYGRGMQWRSGLELGIRLINWVWAMELVRPAGVFDGNFWQEVLPIIQLHIRDITRKYSRYSSANNHLIGEAAGVFMASLYLPDLRQAERYRRQSWEILNQEIIKQTYADGGTREQAFGYHLFVMQFFLIVGLAARRAGHDFPAPYWQRLRLMLEFLSTLCEGQSAPPMFGDCDDGYVLDLGQRLPQPAELLAVGAELFPDSSLQQWQGNFSEPAWWLLGQQHFSHKPSAAQPLKSLSLAESGYYLLRSGRAGDKDAFVLTLDCGELGFGNIAAHGHADALSVTLSVGNQPVLIDSGTYDYFSFSGWRSYFRGTRAHNTLVVDDQDQSEMLGPFLWGRRARCSVLKWQPTQGGGTITAQHDGYHRLPRPVTHRRSVCLNGPGREILIEDELDATGPHSAEIYFHFAPQCQVEQLDSGRCQVTWQQSAHLILELDRLWELRIVRGCETPPLGWFSANYHHKEPCFTVVGRCRCEGRLLSRTRLRVRID